VLLNIFDLYRLDSEEPDQSEENILNIKWGRQRWWYKLAHVCQQWRNIILESPSRLDLHLFCTFGVPVASMLAHSPLLPLTIYYHAKGREITAEDESGIFLALSHCDRVHHVDIRIPNLGTFVTVMDGQFPVLERLYIHSWMKVVLPVTFQAPNLRQLTLSVVSLPIGSLLLTTTAAGLINLELLNIPVSAYPPSYILTLLSLMAKLERLSITFDSPNRRVKWQSPQTPDMITLPNLRQFLYRGTTTYLECLVTRISVPSLGILRVNLFHHLLFSGCPHLCQFIQSSENLTIRAVQVTFHMNVVTLHVVPWKRDNPLMLQIRCDHFHASAVQVFGTLSPVLSVVEQVAFSYDEHSDPPVWHKGVRRSQWRELLRPFTNVKVIYVQDLLISRIFHSLPSEDGEPPLELLPNLEEIGYSVGSDTRDVFTKFLNERQVSGHPVSLRLVDRSMFHLPEYV
jgi:hypothetical protein